MPSSRGTQLRLQSSLSWQAHRQYWQQYIYCKQRRIFHCVSLSSTSLRRMGNGGLAPQNPQAWHWVVSRDNCFPTFRDTLVDLQSSRLLIRRRRFIFQKNRTFIIFVYKMWISVNSLLFKKPHTWFQTFAVFCVLHVFFWEIPRLLNFICRLFGILCSIFIGR